jgi:DNA-binding transcriptional LysR family regulator
MPKPTVSVRVKELEAHLGVKLLQRTTRRISMTADGEAHLERARALSREFAELEAQWRGDVVAPCGRLRVDLIREGIDCVVRGGNVFDDTLAGKKHGELPAITCEVPA